jgi:hypothetical protein
MRLIVSEKTLSRDTLEVVAERLDAVDNVSSSRVIDRLFDTDTLLGMLDQGIAFRRSLELVVSQVVLLATGIPQRRNEDPNSFCQLNRKWLCRNWSSHRQSDFR